MLTRSLPEFPVSFYAKYILIYTVYTLRKTKLEFLVTNELAQHHKDQIAVSVRAESSSNAFWNTEKKSEPTASTTSLCLFLGNISRTPQCRNLHDIYVHPIILYKFFFFFFFLGGGGGLINRIIQFRRYVIALKRSQLVIIECKNTTCSSSSVA